MDGPANFPHPTEPRGCTLEEYARHSVLAIVARRAGVRLPPPDDVADAEPLWAFLHHDRWGVACPHCLDVSYVWHDHPLYMCPVCFNGDVGGKWRAVAVPGPEGRQLVERVTGHRTHPRERNWFPHEGLEDLRAENRAHGDHAPALPRGARLHLHAPLHPDRPVLGPPAAPHASWPTRVRGVA